MNFRNSFLGLTSLFVAGAALLSNGAIAQQALKVGYAPFAVPFNFLPGATPDNYRMLDPKGTMAQGAIVDLLIAVAKDVGVHLKFVPVPAGKQAAALAASKIDLTTTGVGIAPADKGAMDFTRPIYTTSEALVVKKSDRRQYKGSEDLKGKAIGAVKGTLPAEALLKSDLAPDVRLYATAPALLKAVTDGRVAAGFDPNRFNMSYVLQDGKWPDLQMVKSYQPKFYAPTSIGARKDEADVLNKIEISLAKLKAAGTLKTIFAKYGVAVSLEK